MAQPRDTGRTRADSPAIPSRRGMLGGAASSPGQPLCWRHLMLGFAEIERRLLAMLAAKDLPPTATECLNQHRRRRSCADHAPGGAGACWRLADAARLPVAAGCDRGTDHASPATECTRKAAQSAAAPSAGPD